MLYAWTAPIALRNTGTSASATVPAVTGTPGATGDGASAAMAGPAKPDDWVTHGRAAAVDIASAAIAATAHFLMPNASVGRAKVI
jgi:hypothetical protein